MTTLAAVEKLIRKYRVEVEFAKGVWTDVHKTASKADAERVANFWDERLNVRLIEPPRTALESANAKFDALIDALKRNNA